MKKIIWSFLFFLFLFGGVLAYFYLDFHFLDQGLISPLGRQEQKRGGQRPLSKYEFDTLASRQFEGSQITLEKVMAEEEKYTSYLFSFQTDGKKVTGQANIPKTQGKKPVAVMLRGYADDTIYFTGLGTRKAAGFLAENGFITLAPDFLGFGGSDTGSSDIIEARLEKPVTVLNLLVSIKTLPEADTDKIVLWAHSNGGQIALSVLEINKKPIPTTLWAPVTKGFPESVLTFIGELDDKGLKVKKAIDEFMTNYEPGKFSIDHYFADITAPLQVHQGTGDQLVEVEWSDGFVKNLENLGKEVLYWTYKGDDHNLAKNWDLVVQRDLAFFEENLK